MTITASEFRFISDLVRTRSAIVLEPGKEVESATWLGREQAEAAVSDAIERAARAGMTTARWRLPDAH